MRKQISLLIMLFVVASASAQTSPPSFVRGSDSRTQVDNYLVAAKRLGIPSGTTPTLDASVSPENSTKLFYDTDDRTLMVYDPVSTTWSAVSVDLTNYYTKSQVDSAITAEIASIPTPTLQSVTENGKTTNQGIDITSGGLDVQPYLSVIDNEATGNQMSFSKDFDGLLKVHVTGSSNTYSFMADNSLGLYRNSALIAHLTTNSDPKPVLFLRSGLTSSSNSISLRSETTPASTSNTLTMPAVTDTLATKGMLATYIPRGNVRVSDIYTSTPATANRLIAFNGSNATWQPSLQYAIGNGDAALPSSIVQRSTTGAIYAKDVWMVDTSGIRNAGSINVLSRSSTTPTTNGQWQVQGSLGGQYTTPTMTWSWKNSTTAVRHIIGNSPNNSTSFNFLTRDSDDPNAPESSTIKFRIYQGNNREPGGDPNINVARFEGSVLGRMPGSEGDGSGYYGNYATQPYVMAQLGSYVPITGGTTTGPLGSQAGLPVIESANNGPHVLNAASAGVAVGYWDEAGHIEVQDALSFVDPQYRLKIRHSSNIAKGPLFEVFSKATYNSEYALTDRKDLVHKGHMDDAIAAAIPDFANGNYTPTFYANATVISGVTVAMAKYQKLGKSVTVWLDINVSGVTDNGNVFRFSLPTNVDPTVGSSAFVTPILNKLSGQSLGALANYGGGVNKGEIRTETLSALTVTQAKSVGNFLITLNYLAP